MKDFGYLISTRIDLAVLQPTPFCNIDCRYCYLPDRSDKRRMTPEVVEATMRFLLGNPAFLGDRLMIAWHAGEPLTMPISFYEEAFELEERLRPPSVTVRNRITTNATLLTQAWCDLMKRWNVAVRVSIDGPQWLHDGNRVDRSGTGTYSRVRRGIELLQANEIPFEAIGVLSEQSLGHSEELWRFFYELRPISMGFCIEEILDAHQTNSLAVSSATERVQRFFTEMAALRDREAPGFPVREIDHFLERFKFAARPQVVQDARALSILSIGVDGTISTFSPELLGAKSLRHGDFVFGNVLTHGMTDLLESEKLRSIQNEIGSGIVKCSQNCSYFRICGGGWPSAKLFQHGTFDATETLSCQLRTKAVAKAVLEHTHGRAPLIAIEQPVDVRPICTAVPG